VQDLRKGCEAANDPMPEMFQGYLCKEGTQMKFELFVKDEIVNDAKKNGVDVDIFRLTLEEFARDMLREFRRDDTELKVSHWGTIIGRIRR